MIATLPVSADSHAKAPLDLVSRIRLSLIRADIRTIQIDEAEGVVTLRGLVSTFYQKQVIQELTRRVSGVLHVVNRIDVRGPSSVPASRNDLAAAE